MIIFICILCVLGVTFLALLLYGMLHQYEPVTEYYKIESERILSDQRIVLLTDLHGCEHGARNRDLIQMIEKAEPDYLCIAGDMTVKNGMYMSQMLYFLATLARSYRIYYAPGNHEIQMPEYAKYKRQLREIGVQYLDNKVLPIGGNVMLYGLNMPEYWYHKFWQKRELKKEHLQSVFGVCREDCFSILLAHNPEYAKQYAEWGADLTLSGHIHGGIVRLPRLGGVISPSLKLFPKYDAGLYCENGKSLIVSRGLGLHHFKFRLFNHPELSVINLSCQKVAE